MSDPERLSPTSLWSAPPVLMATAPNPGPKTLEGTHTYILGGEDAYIVDPGPDIEEYQRALAGWLQANGRRVTGILLTHGHPDHAPGARTLAELVQAPVHGASRLAPEDARAAGASRELRDGDLFPLDGDRLRVIAAPGHTRDHLVFWLEGARILFAGDVILGRGTTLIAPPEGDMAAYLRTLAALQQLHARMIAPGHGPVIHDPAAKIDEYLRHRKEREEQLLRALQEGEATIEELVRRVYTDVDPRLHGLARGSVDAQLEKLAAEDRVTERNGLFRLAEH